MAGDYYQTTLQAQIGPDGTASALFTVPLHQPFALTRMSAHGNSALPAQLRVYRNAVLFAGSGYANEDVDAEPTPVPLPGGTQLSAVWSGGTPGAVMTLAIEGATL